MQLLEAARQILGPSSFIFYRDFENFATATDGLTSLAADATSSVAAGDTENGVVILTTGATDNNEAAVRSTNELFLVEDNRTLYAACYVQYTEANTDDANVAFGFASAAGANLLVDDGAGPRTSGNQFLIYKVDGETVWRTQSRNGTEVETYQSTQTAGGANYQLLEVFIHNWTSTEVLVSFKVNGARLVDTNTGIPIANKINIASSTEMNLVAYVKAGGANSETPNVDAFVGGQTRNIGF